MQFVTNLAYFFGLLTSFYLFTLWILRRLASLSKIKYLQLRGEIEPNALHSDQLDRPKLLAFFHPYCNSGGGGERVLWTAIRAVMAQYPPHKVRCIVYTGDIDAGPQQILEKVRERFGIDLPYDLDFVYLKYRRFLEPARYPRLTMLMQSLGSIVVGMEAFGRVVPDILFDTTGFAFIYPIFKWLGDCKVLAYVHYPTISSDMLQLVSSRQAVYNNSDAVARNAMLSMLKLRYYNAFADLYGLAGRRCDLALCNSTWTFKHIRYIWDLYDNDGRLGIVYPPCDCSSFLDEARKHGARQDIIVSVAQFRPEKDHVMQLKAFAHFLQTSNYHDKSAVKLILIGGCRDASDERRVVHLRQLAEDLEISDQVIFLLNAPFQMLMHYLSICKIGLHTMWNEHFGIGIVEYQAAGCIALAHKSGGPLIDIVVPYENTPTGYLADSVETFAQCIDEILHLSHDEFLRIASAAQSSASKRFSAQVFEGALMESMNSFLG